ncbi:MAG TPA: TonB-dependent receptor [Stellaceae bacterium]|jgi:outer membrane receptor protein involved in Fe transport|nr:TonB-dependent receptor [Stellaceae bacterium]
MPSPRFRGRYGVAVWALAALAYLPSPAFAQASPAPAAGADGTVLLPELDVVAKELDIARSQIEPSLGASTYDFTRSTIESQPQGDNQSLNELLLQAPGVAQDSFGQLHVRGDHANLQYRLNGVLLPEGINVFGQALETRLADSVSLITGALPAQYGFRTAGIVDIQTKTGAIEPGGALSMYGGSHGWLQPSLEWGGRVGQVDFFVTGDFLRDNIGIENPTSGYNPIHDRTEQGHGFAYLSGIIDPTTRLTAIAGTSRSELQIPNNPGQVPGLGLTVSGASDFNSSLLNENQREITHYGIAALQKKIDALDFQLSAFTRYSSVYFSPDPVGDLLFNGIAQNAYRRSIATGTQGDGSYRLSPDHTLRAGFLLQGERSIAQTNSLVLETGPDGTPLSDQPLSIADSGGKTGWLYGLYLQDEWKITPDVTVNFGARFDLVDQYTHEQQLSPRINVVWQPTEQTTLHAGYSRYFTPPPFELVAPTTLALFQNTTAAPAVTADSPVKAERDHYFDVGASQIVLPGLKIGVDAYYKIAKNLIDEGQFGAPVVLTPFNYARGYAEGIELTTSYDIDQWSLYGNFAVGRAMGEDIISGQFNFSPDELAYIANHYIHLDHDQTYTASAGVAYTFPTKTRVSASVVFGSGLRASTDTVPNGASLPDYQQVNLSVVQKIDTGIFKGLELRLDVINVLDQKYEIRDGTGVGVGAPQYGPRRAVLAGLTQRF